MMAQGTGMAMSLTSYRAPATGRHTDGTVPAGSTHDEMGPNAGHAPHFREHGRARDRSPVAVVPVALARLLRA
jgi:hypothetical protein